MCRLYGFRANELTKVECSLVHAQNALLVQSQGDQSGRTHSDGWGIACYSNLDCEKCLPDLVRHKAAAFDNDHFSNQAESTYAKTVLAHVRLATVGYVGTMNSHPFSYDNWTFAHNGTIPEFDKVRAQMERDSGRFQDSRRGATDSEQLFLWLLNQLVTNGIDIRKPDITRVSEVLAESLARLGSRVNEVSSKPAKLTFLLTNGHTIFAACYNNPLYQLERHGVHDCEICGIPHIRHDDSVDYRAILFASEPITSEDWQSVPNYTLSSIDEGLGAVDTRVIECASGTPT